MTSRLHQYGISNHPINSLRMATFTLEDPELSNLISNIIQRRKSKEIEDWLMQIPQAADSPSLHQEPFGKQLAYKDYKLSFHRWEVKDGSIEQARIQLRRHSRFCGWIENRKIFQFLKNAIVSAYNEQGALSGIRMRGSSYLLEWGIESKLEYEPDSSGQNDRSIGPSNDFIIFKFHRDRKPLNHRI
jgi:hypothetical protein